MNTNPLNTVSLMLTLAGLVGSFFNIQLSQWLRDLMAISQKAELNGLQGDDAQRKAIVECRVELRRLANWQTYVGNLLVLGFVVFVLIDGLAMIASASADPLYPNIDLALRVFLVFFVLISAWMMLNGWLIAKKLKVEIESKRASK